MKRQGLGLPLNATSCYLFIGLRKLERIRDTWVASSSKARFSSWSTNQAHDLKKESNQVGPVFPHDCLFPSRFEKKDGLSSLSYALT